MKRFRNSSSTGLSSGFEETSLVFFHLMQSNMYVGLRVPLFVCAVHALLPEMYILATFSLLLLISAACDFSGKGLPVMKRFRDSSSTGLSSGFEETSLVFFHLMQSSMHGGWKVPLLVCAVHALLPEKKS